MTTRSIRAWRQALASTTLLCAAVAAQAATLLVDGFDAPEAPVTSVFTGIDEATFNTFTSSVPGGVRGVYHHNYTNPLGSVAALSVGNGRLSSSTGVAARTEVLVFYGAFTRPTLEPTVGGPLLGLDATPYDAFRFDFSGVSDTLNLVAVLYTHAPLDPATPLYYSTAAVNVGPTVPGGPMEVVLPFNAGDPFNFAQVDGIAFVINRANNATNVAFNLDSIRLVSSVPEPAPAALLLCGAGVLGWLGRRRAHALRAG